MKNIETMKAIQAQKAGEMAKGSAQLPLNPEAQKLAEHKRLTFDVLTVDTDPLR